LISIAPLFHERVLQEHRVKFAFPVDLTDRYGQFCPLLQNFRQNNETLTYLECLHSLFCGVLGYISPFDASELWELELNDRIYLGYFSAEKNQAKIEIIRETIPLKIEFDHSIDWLIIIGLEEISLYYKDYGNLFSQSFRFADLIEREKLELFYSIFCRRNLLGSPSLPNQARAYQLLEMTRSVEEKLSRDFYVYISALQQKLQRDISYRLQQLSIQEAGLDQKITRLILYRLILIQGLTDRGLLPRNLLQDAYNFVNPYVHQPVWVNFRAIFRWLEFGNQSQAIAPIDIEFFKTNDILDRVIHIGDELCRQMKEIIQFNLKNDIYPVLLGFLLVNLFSAQKVNFRKWRIHKLIQQALPTWNYLAKKIDLSNLVKVKCFDPECGIGLRLMMAFSFIQNLINQMEIDKEQEEMPLHKEVVSLISGIDRDEFKMEITKVVFYLNFGVKIELKDCHKIPENTNLITLE
jgi:hypothetical protein